MCKGSFEEKEKGISVLMDSKDVLHQVRYDNAFSDWSEALPLGNGHFGAMGYLDREDGLIFTFNHYDVYYRSNLSPEALATGNPYVGKGFREVDRKEMKRRALEAHADPNHPAHQNYNVCFWPEVATRWGFPILIAPGVPMAIAGSLRLIPRKGALESAPHATTLEIEKARVRFSLPNLELRSFVAQGSDVFVARVAQTEPGAFESLELSIPKMRLHPIVPVRADGVNGSVFFIENSFWSGTKQGAPPYHYVIAVKLIGAKGELKRHADADVLNVTLQHQAKDMTFLVTVIPPDEGPDLVAAACRKLDDAAGRLDKLETAHQKHWSGFFSASRVSLPDRMLETLWYLHLYSLASCSGEGARLYGEACGLNGLWNIKGPTQWGSSWYWDVNIEQAFWPVFTSNHLELAKPFHKGLLAWVDAARAQAKEYYSLDGIAADYPFTYFMSIWAWCAQYFWWYYTYSGDESFLKETAYPLFKEILRFYEGYAEYDKETGKLVIFPDVCPEQGPLTRNSMSTMSCLKYLLRMGIQSSETLGCDEDLRNTWRDMLNRCGEYAWNTSHQFGEYYMDCEWSEDLLYLGHSGILKPIYPNREITKRSSPTERNRALGTFRYCDGLQAHCTHAIWPAAAAAVLGLGDEAARILYDRGISLQMSASGMFSEETERWMQNCLTYATPVYNPPLIEAGSTVVAVINEMLLQSYDGVIEVFPAIPVGAPTTRYHNDWLNPPHRAPAPVQKWEDCAFENLLAEGAFEVSAWLRGGKTAAVRITSRKGNVVRMIDPFSTEAVVRNGTAKVEHTCQNGVLSFPTTAGQTYEISTGGEAPTTVQKVDADPTLPLVATAFTRRRVFLGKDRDTEFYRALDCAFLDFYPGDLPQSKLTIYKFDFTQPQLRKDYFKVVSWQWHINRKAGGEFVPISADSKYDYTVGRGWADIEHLIYIDRGAPDELRRDFVCSKAAAEFLVFLRAGQYQVVLVSGDQEAASGISVSVPGGTSWESGPLAPGSFAVGTILLNHARDGVASFHVKSPTPSPAWSLCTLIINRIL